MHLPEDSIEVERGGLRQDASEGVRARALSVREEAERTRALARSKPEGRAT